MYGNLHSLYKMSAIRGGKKLERNQTEQRKNKEISVHISRGNTYANANIFNIFIYIKPPYLYI